MVYLAVAYLQYRCSSALKLATPRRGGMVSVVLRFSSSGLVL